jgi:hypothetical protein
VPLLVRARVSSFPHSLSNAGNKRKTHLPLKLKDGESPKSKKAKNKKETKNAASVVSKNETRPLPAIAD